MRGMDSRAGQGAGKRWQVQAVQGESGRYMWLSHCHSFPLLPSTSILGQIDLLSPGALTKAPREPAGSLYWCWQDLLLHAALKKNSEPSLALFSWRFYNLRLEEGQSQ